MVGAFSLAARLSEGFRCVSSVFPLLAIRILGNEETAFSKIGSPVVLLGVGINSLQNDKLCPHKPVNTVC